MGDQTYFRVQHHILGRNYRKGHIVTATELRAEGATIKRLTRLGAVEPLYDDEGKALYDEQMRTGARQFVDADDVDDDEEEEAEQQPGARGYPIGTLRKFCDERGIDYSERTSAETLASMLDQFHAEHPGWTPARETDEEEADLEVDENATGSAAPVVADAANPAQSSAPQPAAPESPAPPAATDEYDAMSDTDLAGVATALGIKTDGQTRDALLKAVRKATGK